jgi:hypothetical protein
MFVVLYCRLNCANRVLYCVQTVNMTLSEPEFLKILKCNLAESVSAGFQFNCNYIFNDKTPNYRHLDHFSGMLKFSEKSLFYH